MIQFKLKKSYFLNIIFIVFVMTCNLFAEFLQKGQPEIEIESAAEEVNEYPSFAKLAKILSPSVVNIAVQAKNDDQEELQQKLLPFMLPPQGKMRSVGSGFIISKDGYVVTNFHVVEDAIKVVVRLLDDKHEYEAKVLGSDQKTDLALLKIDPEGKILNPLFMGDSDQLSVGDWVLAIGNQFQLGQTVTAGIVSAKSRRVSTRSSGPYDDFIQTDASINPGSSGGPLFNRKGQVIGINTAIYSPSRSQFGGTGFNIGIGFAIPINMAGKIIEQLKTDGKVTRGVLGVIIQGLDEDLAKAMGFKDTKGALVSEVRPNSPAADVGFKVRDLITVYEGAEVVDHSDLPFMVAQTPINKKVQIKIIRDGAEQVLTPTIRELTSEFFKSEDASSNKSDYNKLGLRLAEPSEQMRAEMQVQEKHGLLIVDVAEQSIAMEAGLSKGDLLLEMHNKELNTVSQAEQVIETLPKDQAILLLIRKKEGTRFLTLRVKK
jgi:serine protease Do